MKCKECLCKKCMFTMPQGDMTDCHNCDICIDEDMKKLKGECNKFQGWNEK